MILLTKSLGRNPYIIFVAIFVEMLMPKRHLEINRPLATQPMMQRRLNQTEKRTVDSYVLCGSNHIFIYSAAHNFL